MNATITDSYRIDAAPEPTSDDRLWATFAHLGGLFAGFVPALVIWLVKRDDSPFASEHAREALNFQLSVFIYSLFCVVLVFALIGIPMIFALAIFNIVEMIRAAISANKGEEFRYALCLRMIT